MCKQVVLICCIFFISLFLFLATDLFTVEPFTVNVKSEREKIQQLRKDKQKWGNLHDREDKLESREKKLEQEVVAFEKEKDSVRQLKSEKETLETKNRNLLENESGLSMDKNQLKSEIKRLRTQIQTLTSKLETKDSRTEQEIAVLKEQQEEALQLIQMLKTSRDSLEREVDNVQNVSATYNSDAANYADSITS